MEKAKIVLNEPRNTYYSGHLLSGRVECDLMLPLDITVINITFLGEADVKWTEQQTQASYVQLTYTEITYRGHEEYFHYTQRIFGGETPTLLPAGKHRIPFEYKIPHNIPSSFKSRFGQVSYSVIAHIEYSAPDKEGDKVIKKFKVIVPPMEMNKDQLLKPAKIEFEKVYSCFCMPSPLNICVRCPMSYYCPGQTIKVTVTTSNNTFEKLSRLFFQLVRRECYRSNKPPATNSPPAVVLKSVQTGPMLGYTNLGTTFDITVPDMIAHNMTSCGIIDVEYFLRVTVKLCGCKDDLQDETPIFIGLVPVVGTENYKHPLEHHLPNIPIPVPVPVTFYNSDASCPTDTNYPRSNPPYPLEPQSISYPKMTTTDSFYSNTTSTFCDTPLSVPNATSTSTIISPYSNISSPYPTTDLPQTSTTSPYPANKSYFMKQDFSGGCPYPNDSKVKFNVNTSDPDNARQGDPPHTYELTTSTSEIAVTSPLIPRVDSSNSKSISYPDPNICSPAPKSLSNIKTTCDFKNPTNNPPYPIGTEPIPNPDSEVSSYPRNTPYPIIDNASPFPADTESHINPTHLNNNNPPFPLVHVPCPQPDSPGFKSISNAENTPYPVDSTVYPNSASPNINASSRNPINTPPYPTNSSPYLTAASPGFKEISSPLPANNTPNTNSDLQELKDNSKLSNDSPPYPSNASSLSNSATFNSEDTLQYPINKSPYHVQNTPPYPLDIIPRSPITDSPDLKDISKGSSKNLPCPVDNNGPHPSDTSISLNPGSPYPVSIKHSGILPPPCPDPNTSILNNGLPERKYSLTAIPSLRTGNLGFVLPGSARRLSTPLSTGNKTTYPIAHLSTNATMLPSAPPED